MDTAQHIRNIRESVGLTQEEFSKAYEIPLETLKAWEDGSQQPPIYILNMLDLYVKIYPPEKLGAPD